MLYSSKNMATLKEKWAETEGVRGPLLAVGIILLCFLALIAANVFDSTTKSTPATYNSTSDYSTATTTNSVVPHAAPPLTDTEKYIKAKTLLAGWKGSEDDYGYSLDLLSGIREGSPVYTKSRALASKWHKRLEEHKEREQDEKLEKERAAKEQATREAKDAMNTFSGDSDAKVAVAGVRLKHSTDSHVAGGHSIFVYLYVDVKNFGNSTVSINPNDFTLATQDGQVVPYDADTFETGKPFPAVDLSPGQASGGWLVFYLSKDSKYVLTRRDMRDDSTTEKVIIP